MILEEGNRPYPMFPQCDIIVSHKALNCRHMKTSFCWQVVERKQHCLVEEEARAGAEMAFTVDGIPLSQVTSFKYLGRILTAEDDD